MKFFIVLSLAGLVLASGPAQAMSCSDYKAICVIRAKNPKNCDGAWKRCMKTGNYTGPESGTNHGQADKH